MCYYYKKNYAMAQRSFDACINSYNNAFSEEARFYKAISMKEMGDTTSALGLMKEIKQGGGFYAIRVDEYLNP
jgi:hypothetical protein